MRGFYVGVVMAVGVLMGCEGGMGGLGAQPERAVFSDRQLLTGPEDGAARGLPLGELCRPGLVGDCSSGLCLLRAAHPGATHDAYCSSRCRGQEDCPREWTCSAVLPGPDGWLCVPPAGWQPRAVTAGRQP